ncbi:Protein kinase-like domain containing protein [Amanita muscaria]
MAHKKPCAKYQYVVTPSGPKILPVDEPSCKDEESPADYNAGGYLPIKVNDTFRNNRYRIVRKLGWGHFSTVWLVKDTQYVSRHSALKVVKSAGRYAETARDEIMLLSRVQSFSPDHPGRCHIVSFTDSFTHQGPESTHICIVFEPLGENLLGLIERYKKKGVPRSLVRVIAKQILLGLEYLHDECDLVHTDIKPENILICIPEIEIHIQNELSRSPSPTSRRVGVPLPTKTRSGVTIPQLHQRPRRQVQIFDSQPLSSPSRSLARSCHSSFSSSVHPSVVGRSGTTASFGSPLINCSALASNLKSGTEYDNKPGHPETPSLQPKAISDYPPSSSSSSSSSIGNPDISILPPPILVKIADLGNATPCTKHYTDDIQTRQYRSPEAILGRSDWDARVDMWSVACLVFELLTGEYLFDPQGQGELFTKDDDHMAQIIELLGDFPAEVKMSGKYSREIFDHTGALRYIRALRFWPLKRVMVEKYLYSEQESTALCKFLEPMLATDMRQRAHASYMKNHKWLEPCDADETNAE